jgi:N-methylhydantoinase A
VNIESTVYGRVSKPNPPRFAEGGPDASHAKDHERKMVFQGADGKIKQVMAPVYDGAKMLAGNKIVGPAVIEEETTSIVVEPGWNTVLKQDGTFYLTQS